MELRKGDVVLYSVVLLSFWACVSASLTDVIGEEEVMALKDVISSLDPSYDFVSWSALDYCPPSEMFGCSSYGHVISLFATGQNFSGSISRSIGNLTYLEILLLPNNNISGPIPSELGSLQNLESIDLSNNLLTGKIPSSLSQAESLQDLDLSFNNLSGPVPRHLGKTLNILGNPMICETGMEPTECNGTITNTISFSSNNSHKRTQSHKVAVAVGTSLACSFLLVAGFSFFIMRWRRKYTQQIFFDVNEQKHEEVCLGNLRRFQFSELQIATNNFSSNNILGKGGFGNVYKGHLQDGLIVAVKRLKDGHAIRREIQFQTEAEMISLAVHRNLLRLYGFCITTNERLLVYPYMSNGSVASRLKAKPPLDWGTRKKIALGAARGLLYLHEQCDSKIIHRDVKAANILLDDNCEAVVGDFGLAKLLGHCDSHVTTAVRGTVGHIAPEYLSTGQSSEKTDIFGFGIFLLELITGQRAIESCKAANLKGPMLVWVKKIHQEKKLEMLVDKKLKDNYDSSELEEMVKVALLCTQHDQSHRPIMSEVVGMLQGNGLAEKWEASQIAEANICKENESLSSERHSDLTGDSSSLLVKAVEILRGWKRMGNL